MIELSEIWEAYLDGRVHKRTSKDCARYEVLLMERLPELQKAINNGTYQIGRSVSFVVTRPKLREVFAADFGDRIVHHLVIKRTLQIFEDYFIDDTYNCRKGRGTLFGALRVQDMIRMESNNYTRDCWVLKCDIQSFFMSIDKELLADKLEVFMNEKYTGEDKELLIKLMRQIVLHRPELCCEIHGDKKLWNILPREKSLFGTDGTRGLPIGNLTSQIFANFYLAEFDHWVSSQGVLFARYVDDFLVISHDKERVLKLIPEIQKFLSERLRLKLHPRKISLQPYYNGVKFTGFVIKKDRLYTANRTVYNTKSMIQEYNDHADKPKWLINHIEEFAQRYNSYMGFLGHTRSFNIRVKMWNLVDDRIKKYCYTTNNFAVLKVRNEYKSKNIRYNELQRNKSSKRRVQKGTTNTRNNVIQVPGQNHRRRRQCSSR